MIEDYDLELTANPGSGADTTKGQAVTTTGVSYGTKPYEIGPGNDPAIGEPLQAICQFQQNFNNMTSMVIDLINDDDGLGTNAVVVATSGTILLANATVARGAFRLGGIVAPQQITRRYLTARVTVTGPAPTTGRYRVVLQNGAFVIPANAGAL